MDGRGKEREGRTRHFPSMWIGGGHVSPPFPILPPFSWTVVEGQMVRGTACAPLGYTCAHNREEDLGLCTVEEEKVAFYLAYSVPHAHGMRRGGEEER